MYIATHPNFEHINLTECRISIDQKILSNIPLFTFPSMSFMNFPIPPENLEIV